nr:ABC transporter permease [Tuberibacillus sp. Marseille-P3662]
MTFWQSIKMALRHIKGNKFRGFLTMLGMIIGVSSVIALVALGQGSSQDVKSSINNLGTNRLTVNITDSDEIKFTRDDVDKLGSLDGVESVAPVVSGRVTVAHGETSTQISLTGTTSAYPNVQHTEMSQGRFLSDISNEYRLKTAVLGANTAQTLFGGQDPIGKQVKINGTSYRIVGVLKSIGGSMGQSGDDVVIVPLTTAQTIVNTTDIPTVQLNVQSQDIVDQTMMNVKMSMATQYPDKDDSYSVFSQEDTMDAMNSVSQSMATLLGGIAGISLLVAGIGIMNIMLVSVSERTKEIGIHKAIGAKRRDILQLFLIEAVVLSCLGGMIGVGVGLAVTKLLSITMDMTAVYSVSIPSIAFLFSLIVGIVFGVFPAIKAAKLHPIQALRYE